MPGLHGRIFAGAKIGEPDSDRSCVFPIWKSFLGPPPLLIFYRRVVIYVATAGEKRWVGSFFKRYKSRCVIIVALLICCRDIFFFFSCVPCYFWGGNNLISRVGAAHFKSLLLLPLGLYNYTLVQIWKPVFNPGPSGLTVEIFRIHFWFHRRVDILCGDTIY